ncbi:B12-binding domain-containing radical SAM protein [Saccharicrinis sp. FJH2]|uniref:B12-binding domain-containing radical SAM protein n=1 Tax=Saccharicrinis sp. FJH65 TaxID=3344659 RepID=UPI0035F461DB
MIFPPVWLPDVPFLSTPALTAFLKQNNIEVEQIDLNIEFWQNLYSADYLSLLHITLIETFNDLTAKTELNQNEIEVIKKLSIIIELSNSQFVDEVSKGIITRDVLLELIGFSNEFKSYTSNITKNDNHSDNLIKQDYHDLLYSNISLSQYSYSIKNLLSISTDRENPYHLFYSDFFNTKSKLETPCLFGISIAANNQVVPAFTLAYFIKRHNKNSKVVIGGSWCTLVERELAKHLLQFEFIDYMVVREGEVPLLKLIQALKNSSEPEQINGIYYKKNEEVLFNNSFENLSQDILPTPDFSGLHINPYFEKDTLPIQTSRGCYWGKCIFCSYPLIEQKFKQRNVDKVIEDIKRLQYLYGTKVFSFVDSLVSPSFAHKLSDRLIAENIIIEWVILARFEKQFTLELLRKMSKSGCTTICWGLESGNQRVLDVIQKNINLDVAENILIHSSSAKIHNRVLVMFGLPTETFLEANDTIDFIKRNNKNIHSLSYNFYHPEKNTPIENYSKTYNIQLKQNPNEELNYGYDWQSEMSKNEIISIFNAYTKLNNLIQKAENNYTRINNIHQIINNNTINSSFSVGNENHLIISFIKNYKRPERYFYEVINN